MIERFRETAFGWMVRPVAAPEKLLSEVPPPKTLEQQLLGILNLRSFEQAGIDAEVRQAHGLMPGWVDEIQNAAGVVIDYRHRSYRSMVEAGVDYLVAQVDDPAAAVEAKRLQPLVRRWTLLRERDALVGVPVPESAPRAHERAATPERATVAADYTYDGNRIALHAQRRAIEAEHRDAMVEQFNERSRNLIGDVAPAFNPISERVRIDRELAEWNEKHAGLAAEIASFQA